jgi:hypothetical protein
MSKAVRGILSTGLLIVLGGVVSGCTEDFPNGPAGKVVERERDYDCEKVATSTAKSCAWDYYLTVRNGSDWPVTFQVTYEDYEKCVRGSQYPKCLSKKS